jgi:uncharacterized protein YhjY with autotransporter beta-barrel domain
MKSESACLLALLAFALGVTNSSAAIIAVDATTGNLVVTAADSGANTITATGGTNPAPYTVTVNLGAVLTGDPTREVGISVTRAGYTLWNSGSLSGNLNGVLTTASVTINNAGSITGLNASGIQTVANTDISNSGIISGANNGIFATTGLNLTNTATIIGGTAEGILATSGSVTGNAGSISGVTGVLFSGGATSDSLTLTGGSLTGTGGTAASLGNGNDIFNLSGSATVTGNVSLGGNDDTAVISGGTLTGDLLAEGGNDTITLAGGDILGTLIAGIGDDNVTINGGSITGPNAATLGGGNDILNINGGTITGNINGEGDNDVINFASGTSITGTVNGGPGSDVLNFAGDTLVQSSGFNAITNMEVINKTGTGTTTVNGATQTDVINLGAGGLFLNGNLSPVTAGGTMAINQTGGHLGGVLSGATGAWLADLQITGGTFSPGSTLPSGGLVSSIGTLALTSANFNGGSLLVHANPATPSSDLLKVTGNLALNNTPIIISPLTKDAPLSTMTIVDVGGTTSGTWQQPVIVFENGYTDSGLTSPGGTGIFTPSTFTISAVPGADDPDDIVIQIVHRYETLPGLTSFGTGFAETLNSAVAAASSDPLLADFLGALDYSDPAFAAGAINSLEPDGYLDALMAAVSSTTLLHRVVEGQNQAARSTRNFNRGWANYNLSDQGGTANYFTAGMGGGSMIDQTNFGALISHMTMDDWYGGGSDLTTTTFGVYAGTGGLVGWQWDAFAGYVMADGNFQTQSSSVPATMEPEGDGWQFLLSGAYVMQNDRLSWGPTFGLEYINLDFDKTTAKRSGGLPSIDVDSDSLESLRMMLGVKFEYDMPGSTTPYLGIQYVAEFMGDIDGYNASVSGGSFNVSDPMELGDALILRAGVMHRFNQHWQANAGYLGETALGSDGQDFHSLNLGVMANF